MYVSSVIRRREGDMRMRRQRDRHRKAGAGEGQKDLPDVI
jgi:hypothetical protein